jgi:hypothetical protein
MDRRPRLGAVAVAVLADRDRVEADLAPGPLGDVGELDLDADEDVAAVGGAAATAEAERPAEAAGAAEQALQEVVERAERAGPRVVAAGAQALVAVGVVGAAALGVG